MLTLFSSRNGTACDGSTRRDFLRIGALGLGGLSLPDLLRAREAAAALAQPTQNTSVVWLWLGGGPTHVETFDPKMSAPVEFRSTIGAVQTNVPGVELGGIFPKMAAHGRQDGLRPLVRPPQLRPRRRHALGHDRLRLRRRPTTAGGQIKPGLGSILARHRGPNNARTGLPTYVRLNGILGDGPAWLGSAYAPFDAAGNARNNMNAQGRRSTASTTAGPAQGLRHASTATSIAAA